MPEDLAIAWEKRPFHGDGRCVAFADGHVTRCPAGEFQRVLADVQEYLEKVEKE
jgi:prepilin-type processing-associated H-X9-DG protein